MTLQATAVERSVQTTEADTRPAESMTASPNQPQDGVHLSELLATGKAEVVRLAHAAEAIPPSKIVFVSAATLTTAAFFVAGLTQFRVGPAFRRVLVKAEEIRIPMFLPVMVVDIVRELLADSSAMTSSAARRHASE